jgi:hypothetical protein
MLTVIFTLDYEIHGNGDGSPDLLMVEPTRRMLDQFDRYGAKLTIMADVAEILKFREYHERTGRDDYNYKAIAAQLCDAIRRGHDVQLHLHSSYFNAQYDQGRWLQDWSEYNFAALPPERLNEVLRLGKHFLESSLRPVDDAYRCCVFRAANWSMSPSRNPVRALIDNGFKIDTSVFKYGRREGIVRFDYSNAHSDLAPWPVDEDDICRRNDAGKLIESPIYCELRSIGSFATLHRIRRVLMTRSHPLSADFPGAESAPVGPRHSLKKLASPFLKLARRHPWKADFNQSTGRQLSRALRRASRRHDPRGDQQLPFVLIGHSKHFTPANERSLAYFLDYVTRLPALYRFGTFRDIL